MRPGPSLGWKIEPVWEQCLPAKGIFRAIGRVDAVEVARHVALGGDALGGWGQPDHAKAVACQPVGFVTQHPVPVLPV